MRLIVIIVTWALIIFVYKDGHAVVSTTGQSFYTPTGNNTSFREETSHTVRVISYLPYYNISSVSKEVLNHLTHVNYFSLGVDSSGELGRINGSGTFLHLNQIPQVAKDLDTLKSWRTESETQIFVVFGGWVQSDYFDEMAASDEARANFVKNVKTLLLNNGVDGADIDWEGYHGEVNDSNYGKLLSELKTAFEGTSLQLSVAIGKTHTSLADEFTNNKVDHIGLMTYGRVFGDGMQVSIAQLNEYVQQWIDAGAKADKLVAGVPFYGRTPTDGSSIKYSEIVSLYDSEASVNSVVHNSKTYYYNGIDAIKEKATYVLESGLKGIMIWEQGYDVDINNPKSLLKSISEVIPVGTVVGITESEIPIENDNINFQVYPSPVSDHLNVKLNTSINSAVIFSIHDIYGRKIEQVATKRKMESEHTYTIPVASLKNGIYLLRLTYNNKTDSIKFIKQ